MASLNELLAKLNISSREDQTLAELTTFKVGGPADLVLYPETVAQCADLIQLAAKQNKKLVFLGNGSNILGADRGCRDWILKTDRLSELSINEKGVMTVGAGVKLVKASSFAAKAGYAGLEFAYGIPGTLGGAVFMNAGAYDGSMDMVVLRTRYLDGNGDLHTLEGAEHQFGYRMSFFMEHPDYLIVSADIQLAPGDHSAIQAKIHDFQQRRKDKQPLEYPSAGSTFKRPEGYFAGKLIQDAGLKGYSVGGAQVSEKHAGFVINRGGATGGDIRRLIRHVQNEVRDQFGVQLECEIRCLGEE